MPVTAKEVPVADAGLHLRAHHIIVEEMKKNEQVVLAAILQNGSTLQYVAKEMKNNRRWCWLLSEAKGHEPQILCCEGNEKQRFLESFRSMIVNH